MPNSHCLEPYDAFMLVSYGGPNGPDDVIPFLRNATGGAGIPDERLAEVGTHYGLFGGVSPINQKNAELLEALRQRLDPQGRIPFVIGNRNWHPYFSEALLDLVDQGRYLLRPIPLIPGVASIGKTWRQLWRKCARRDPKFSLTVSSWSWGGPGLLPTLPVSSPLTPTPSKPPSRTWDPAKSHIW